MMGRFFNRSSFDVQVTDVSETDLADAGTRSKDMILVPGGTFHMGSDKHYPEEAPAHRASVDPFWIDRTSVTNREFRKFVNTTGYVTFAEITPDPKISSTASIGQTSRGSATSTRRGCTSSRT